MGTHPPRVAVRVPSRPHAVRMPLRHGCPRSPATDRQHVRPAPSLRCPAEASRPHRDYIPTSLRARNGPLHNENRLQSAQLGHTRARAPWFARISWTMTAGRAGEIAPEPRLPHRPCGHRCPVRVSRAGWRDRIHRRDGVDGLRSDHHQANRAGAQHTCRSDRLGAVPAGGPSERGGRSTRSASLAPRSPLSAAPSICRRSGISLSSVSCCCSPQCRWSDQHVADSVKPLTWSIRRSGHRWPLAARSASSPE